MSTPFPSRQPSAAGSLKSTNSDRTNSDGTWRCTCCGKLLGICRDGRMHLRFSRAHEYLVGFPVQATCRDCGTLNHIGL